MERLMSLLKCNLNVNEISWNPYHVHTIQMWDRIKYEIWEGKRKVKASLDEQVVYNFSAAIAGAAFDAVST